MEAEAGGSVVRARARLVTGLADEGVVSGGLGDVGRT